MILKRFKKIVNEHFYVNLFYLNITLRKGYLDIFFFQVCRLVAKVLKSVFRGFLKNQLEAVITKIDANLSYKIVKRVEKLYKVKFHPYPEINHSLMEIYFYKQYSRLNNFIPKKEWGVVDCGSTCGEYSIYVSSKCAKCISVEPNPDYYEQLLKNIELNGLGGKIFPVNKAVSSKISKIRIKYKNKTISSETTTIDNLVKKYKLEPVNLLKIDVEGYEYHTLIGSKNTIEKFKPKIIIEIHSRKILRKILRYLNKYGYRIVYSNNFPYRSDKMDMVNVFYFE
ncbi:MAG: FkbM family methyltransferase [Candidatus Aenigmarchaeota archaeon]|nr:FkbM family methyltransferase [Candidatus Aenigmarchaeota archaeon]MDW8159913.1 FkbM family methyltransferase [Candidatus Aenigmarchaeota archaeon]